MATSKKSKNVFMNLFTLLNRSFTFCLKFYNLVITFTILVLNSHNFMFLSWTPSLYYILIVSCFLSLTRSLYYILIMSCFSSWIVSFILLQNRMSKHRFVKLIVRNVWAQQIHPVPQILAWACQLYFSNVSLLRQLLRLFYCHRLFLFFFVLKSHK